MRGLPIRSVEYATDPVGSMRWCPIPCLRGNLDGYHEGCRLGRSSTKEWIDEAVEVFRMGDRLGFSSRQFQLLETPSGHPLVQQTEAGGGVAKNVVPLNEKSAQVSVWIYR